MHRILYYLWDELKRYWQDYALLIVAGLLSLGALKALQGNKQSQFITMVLFTIFYTCWGLYHHFITKSLHARIVLEYVLMGTLFIVLISIVIFS